MSSCCNNGYSRKPKGSIRQFVCYLLGLGNTNTLSSATKFIITQGDQVLSVTWADLLKNIVIPVPPVQTKKIIEIDDDYQLVGDEDIIACTGALTITLIPVSESVKDVTIDSDGGTVTFVAAAGDSLESANVVSGNKLTIYGKKSTNTWRSA